MTKCVSHSLDYNHSFRKWYLNKCFSQNFTLKTKLECNRFHLKFNMSLSFKFTLNDVTSYKSLLEHFLPIISMYSLIQVIIKCLTQLSHFTLFTSLLSSFDLFVSCICTYFKIISNLCKNCVCLFIYSCNLLILCHKFFQFFSNKINTSHSSLLLKY